MKYRSRTDSLTGAVYPGTYRTRNGRRAVITDANTVLSDGYIEATKRAKRRSTCWQTPNGRSCWAGRSGPAWDLVERIEE